MSHTIVHSASSYNKTCKHILRAGDRLGRECGKGCTYDVYGHRVDYCASHYVWNLTHLKPEPVPQPRKVFHPPYRVMVLNAVKDGGEKVSGIAINKYIQENYIVPSTAKHYIRRALVRLVEYGKLDKIGMSYQLPKSHVTQE